MTAHNLARCCIVGGHRPPLQSPPPKEMMLIRKCPTLGMAIRSLIFAVVVTSTGAAIAHAQSVVISVSNTEKLYQAVNNPANSGAVVVLAPGIYTLTPKDPNGQSRLNGGRLVLQTGMALVGQNEYVDFDADA